MLKKISLLILLTLGTVSASDTVKPIIQIGYDWGGTTLTTVSHENYDYYGNRYTNNSKIKAGQGLNFDAGAVMGNDNSNMELQFLVGYKFDSDTASNGDVTWDVIPFTALAMFKSQRWKVGGGITYHLNPELDASLPTYDKDGKFLGNGVDDKYNSAFGGVAQIQYRATEALSLGIKGTFIEYELKNDPTITADGNSIGFVLSYTFGNERSEFR